jgi:AcrR family transcriptional regulator
VKQARIDVASIRRDQIIEAAVAVIAEQGLQSLSLSEIEKRAGMSRGQLTYYFPAKEDILLAVFDHLLQLMYRRLGTPDGQPAEQAGVWKWVQHLLATVPAQRQANPEFHSLQYTFLAQMGPREDFRRRLASLYEEWRSGMTGGFAREFEQRPPQRTVAPRALATLIQAILHGLAMQAAADPQAFDSEEMRNLCLDMLGSYLWGNPTTGKTEQKTANNGNGVHHGSDSDSATRGLATSAPKNGGSSGARHRNRPPAAKRGRHR